MLRFLILGEITNQLFTRISLKMVDRSEALRQNQNLGNFEA